MTHHPIPQPRLDRWFRIILVLKGADGVLELIGGVALLAIPSQALHHWIVDVGRNDLVIDHDLLTHAVTSLSHSFTSGVQIYTAIYLLLHGVIKVGLVTALLSRRYSWYPAAIAILVLFMVYQIYRIFTEHQFIFDATLTVVDGVVVWLTILEYQRHRPARELPSD